MNERKPNAPHAHARLAVGLCLGLAGAVAMAATMGFKIKANLTKADGGVTSSTGRNAVSLPYVRKPGLNTAYDLMNDIGFANVQSVQRYLSATDVFQAYTGRKGSSVADFNLVPGQAYVVRMNTTVNYTIAGFHDESVTITLRAPDGGQTSANGINLVSVPSHTTAQTAYDLMNDIGFANVASIGRHLKQTDAIVQYTGRAGSPGPNFNLVRGEGYFVKMNTTVNYTPSHY